MAQRLSVSLQCRKPGFYPWVGKIPWRRKWQPTPVFLPGESHGCRSLVGYSPWGHKESDMTERLHFHFQCFLCVAVQFSSVAQSCPTLCDPIITARQASLSITNSQSSPKFMCIETVMPFAHLIFCHPLLLLPPIPPSVRVLSNESTLCMRWPKYLEFQLQHQSFQ